MRHPDQTTFRRYVRSTRRKTNKNMYSDLKKRSNLLNFFLLLTILKKKKIYLTIFYDNILQYIFKNSVNLSFFCCNFSSVFRSYYENSKNYLCNASTNQDLESETYTTIIVDRISFSSKSRDDIHK